MNRLVEDLAEVANADQKPYRFGKQVSFYLLSDQNRGCLLFRSRKKYACKHFNRGRFTRPLGPMNAMRSPCLTEKEISLTATISLVSGENRFFNQPEDEFTEKENFFVRLDTVIEFVFIIKLF